MKNQHSVATRAGARWRARLLSLAALLSLGGVACSSGGPSATAPYQTTGSASPGTDGNALPPPAGDPEATETNFTRLVCQADAECPNGERCVAEPPAADAGADAGVLLGRCLAAAP